MNAMTQKIIKQFSVTAFYIVLGIIDYRYFTGAIWFGSGLALAVILIGGWRYLGGIFIGSVILAFIPFSAPVQSIEIIIGTTISHVLEAFLGAWLLNFRQAFILQTLRDYLRLILLGGVVPCFIGANISISSFVFVNAISLNNYIDSVQLWWMEDSMGVILLTPLILAWKNTAFKFVPHQEWLEALLSISGTFLIGQTVFLGWSNEFFGISPKSFILFLPITLIAIRHDKRAVTLTLNMLAIQILCGAYLKVGCFANENFSMQHYWLYIVTLSVIGMALTTYVNEIKRTKYYQQALLDNFPFIIWLKDTESRFLAVNKMLSERFGEKTPAHMMNKTDFDYSPSEMAELYQYDDKAVLRSGQTKNLEEEIVDRFGNKTWFETFKAPVFNDKGIALGTLGFARDITSRKESEEKLKQLLEDERKSRLEQSQFMAMLAHELRTPLSVIEMSLGSKEISPSLIFHAKRAVADVDNVIKRCLQSEQLSDNQISVKKNPCSLLRIIHDLCDQSTFQERFIIEARIYPVIKTDEQLLHTVLSNLIDNSLKYSLPNSSIHILLTGENDGILMLIQNEIGVASYPDPQKVFQKYYRHKAAHHKTGSGLGLYLVKTISQLLGGDISYISDKTSVTFKLWLPI